MKIVTMAEVEDHFSTYLEASKATPIVITRNNKPVARLIVIDNEADPDSLLLANNPRFAQLLAEARERMRGGSGIPLATFRKQIEQDACGEDTATVQVENDPLIGLFAGPPDLSEQCETILEQAAQEHAGWTLK